MSSKTISTQESAHCRKIAQLRAAIKDQIGIEYLEIILQKEGSIRYEATKFKNALDFGLLHFACDRNATLRVFDLLIENGVDFTVKDSEGQTLIHKIIQLQYNTHDSCLYEFEDRLTELILAAHVKFENRSNPSCKYNISHFHVACLKNHVEAVEFFLKNEVDVNEAVNEDSPVFAGFTPLHLAVKCSHLPTVKILLKYGANVRYRNAAGISSLLLSMEQVDNKEIRKFKSADDDVLELLAKQAIDEKNVTIADNFGLSNLHISCVIKDTSYLDTILSDRWVDLDQSIKMHSPFCPGYTPLHFAAGSNMNTVKLLIDKGADIEAKDAKGITPLDLCLRRYGVKDILDIISSQARWKDIVLSDDQTRLEDLVYAMTSDEDFGKFIGSFESIPDLIIPSDSPLWPGYTILHLAVMFSERAKGESNYFEYTSDTSKIKECLIRGAVITKADSNGSTALHLAFYLQKFRTVKHLLQHHVTVENPVDNNNLSHFHIACAAGAENAVEKFLSNGVDVNVPITATIEWRVSVRFGSNCESRHLLLTPGSTALHVSAACGNTNITRMLLEQGADVYAKDVNGFTPVHRLLTASMMPSNDGIDGLLLSIEDLHDSVAEGGLSHIYMSLAASIIIAESWRDFSNPELR